MSGLDTSFGQRLCVMSGDLKVGVVQDGLSCVSGCYVRVGERSCVRLGESM